MRLLICAGGTGGGVNPALAVLDALMSEAADMQTLWVGTQGGMEAALVERAGIAFQAIPAAGIHGVDWKALPGNLLRLLRGGFASRRILRSFKPDVLFFTGGDLLLTVFALTLAGIFLVLGAYKASSPYSFIGYSYGDEMSIVPAVAGG